MKTKNVLKSQLESDLFQDLKEKESEQIKGGVHIQPIKFERRWIVPRFGSHQKRTYLISEPAYWWGINSTI